MVGWIRQIFNATLNYMMPLAAFIIALCDMKLERIYFSWSMISIANTLVFNILVFNYKPTIILRQISTIEDGRTL